MRPPPEPVSAWASRGAMALTGWPDHPGLGPPAPLVARLDAVAQRLARLTAARGHEVVIDPIALLTERAALAGFTRAGTISCGGATRLLAGADGWLALSLARASDVDLVPAWLELEASAWPRRPALADEDLWAELARRVTGRSLAELDARAALLGLPVGILPAGMRWHDPARSRTAMPDCPCGRRCPRRRAGAGARRAVGGRPVLVVGGPAVRSDPGRRRRHRGQGGVGRPPGRGRWGGPMGPDRAWPSSSI